MSRDLALSSAVLFFGCVSACSPSALDVQRDAAAVVGEASEPMLKALELAAKLDTARVVDESDSREEAERRVAQRKELWDRVFRAWNAFVIADEAWIAALDEGKDAFEKAQAAKDAFCAVRSSAADVGVKLIDFPLGACP